MRDNNWTQSAAPLAKGRVGFENFLQQDDGKSASQKKSGSEMNSTDHDPLERTSTTEFLEAANSEFEKGFAIAAMVAKEMNCLDESQLASKHVFSYNPGNKQVLNLFPELKTLVTYLNGVIENYTKYIHDPDCSADVWTVLGNCYLILGDFPNSFAAYAHAQRKSPDNDDPQFWYTMGIVYHHYRYTEHARSCFEKVLLYKNFKYIVDLKFRLAVLYRTAALYDDALKYFNDISANPPNDLLSDDIQLQIAYTYQFKGSGGYDRASAIYSQLRKKYPNLIELSQQYIWFLYLTSSEDQLPAVQNLLKDELDKYPNEPTLLLLSARIAMKLNNMSVAYQKYRSCIGYWSDTPFFWCGLGVLYFKNEQMQDAVIAFQRALYLKSDLVEAWLNLGLIFEQQQDTTGALKIYTTAKPNCPTSTSLDDRINSLNSAKGTKRPMNQLIDIEDTKFFHQIPDKFASEYISAVPKLPNSCFKNTDLSFDTLSTLPQTMFAHDQ